MKLYFAAHTCSFAPHVVLRELGLPHTLVRVDNRSKRTADGGSFLDVNPKGYVAALKLDDGRVLTEGPAILQYLADLDPQARLAPPNGSWARVQLQEMLSFVTSEIHAGCSPLFDAELPAAAKDRLARKLRTRLDHLDATLSIDAYLLGTFGVADVYLYTVLTWLPGFGIDVEQWPALARFMARIGARESVHAALAAEAAAAPV